MDDGAIVVRLDVERLELDRPAQLHVGGVVLAERAQCAGVARAERSVFGLLGDEARVLAGGLFEAAGLEGDRGEVPVARFRFRADIAQALQLLDDLRIDLRVGRGGRRSGRGHGVRTRPGRLVARDRRGNREIQGLPEDASRHVRRASEAVEREDRRRDVEDRRAVEPHPRLHAVPVQVEDAFRPVERLAHAAHVARLRGIVLELAELEAVVREDEERGLPVHRGHDAAEQPVGVGVHLLDRAAVLLLLRRELARQLRSPEEMAEKVRGRVHALDVEKEVVRSVLLPEVQADAGISLGGRPGPLEVGQVVLEVERARELFGGHRDEGRDLAGGHVHRLFQMRRDPLLGFGRRDLAGTAGGPGGAFLHQEVVCEVIRDDGAADSSPRARSPTSPRRRPCGRGRRGCSRPPGRGASDWSPGAARRWSG